MSISKNQIWVLIAIVAIGVIALVSDVEIKVEIGEENYASFQECDLRENQKCPAGDNVCGSTVYGYCETLDYPEQD